MTITYTTGDATRPVGGGPKIIAHIVNDEGKWGSGFVVALSRQDTNPEKAYRAWSVHDWERHMHLIPAGFEQRAFKLGEVQLVPYMAHGVWVANMAAQRGVRRDPSSPRAVQYGALHGCLERVAMEAWRLGASVHMPRIGCGLGGGDWDAVEYIINNTLVSRGITVTVYDLPAKENQ